MRWLRPKGELGVWKAAIFLQPSYDRCLLSLSRGGADATVTREFDVTRRSLSQTVVLLEAKSRLSWRDVDSVFVATDFGPGSLTQAGYPRVVKEWRRGTAVADAVQVFAGQLTDVSVGAFRTKTPGYERDWIARSVTFWTHELFLRRDGTLIKIEKPDDARTFADRDLLYIESLNLSSCSSSNLSRRRGVSPLRYGLIILQRCEPLRGLLVPMDPTFDLPELLRVV